MKNGVGWESNPDLLLRKQLCRPRGLPLTEISYTSAEISNEILKSPAKSEIFCEIPKSLKSLPKSAKS